jgi:hypothetical protein
MRHVLSLAILCCMAMPAAAAPFDADCVPAGGELTLDFDRPELGPGSNLPVSAQWAGGDGMPQALDIDGGGWLTGGGPDELGAGTSGPTSSVTLQNSGGLLFGPNGASAYDHAGEGSCQEVSMRWSYDYVAFVTTCRQQGVQATSTSGETTATSTSSTTSCVTVEVWRRGHVVVGPVEVCPC